MNRNAQVFLILALIVLLGLAASLSLLLMDVSQNGLLGQKFGMPRFMGPGMMRRSGASIGSEYEFLVHMIPHHEEAVHMAHILKVNTEREEMRQFAEGIIRTQTNEVEQMKAWLTAWYPDEDHVIAYQPMMRDLEGLQGSAVDEAFIMDMIPHHMEAVMMSQQLLVRGLAEHDDVIVLAREIQNNQRDEIHLMMRWIADWNRIGSGSGVLLSIMMWAGLIALVILISIVIWLILSQSSRKRQQGSTVRSVREKLDIRYARGEISQEEYLIARKVLES
jgi:uncharacterized protein (DUF305 family)